MDQPAPGLEFTFDWTSPHVAVWDKVLKRFKHRRDLRILEIGVFEGRSTIWLAEHIATGSGARIDCIDSFDRELMAAEIGTDPGDYKARFYHNLQASGVIKTIGHVFDGDSIGILGKLPKQYYDAIYLDGDHDADHVYRDLAECWRILTPAGVLIIDDLDWSGLKSNGPTAPRHGIARFEKDHEPIVLWRGDQLIVTKARSHEQAQNIGE